MLAAVEAEQAAPSKVQGHVAKMHSLIFLIRSSS
jgi:hypothetical protein